MLNFKEQAGQFELFLQQQQEKGLFKGAPQNLYDPCNYMLQLGGKRIRPAVCLMAAELFKKDINEDVYWSALAVELFHNFTLVHDDIMDEAPLRRGKATVYKQYNTTAAILSGDVMNIYAYRCLQYIGPAQLPAVLSLFNKTAIEVCEGQQYDMDFEQKDIVAEADYIEMIRLKTAVLLAASMQMGALCAGAPEEQAKLIYAFGLNLGIAFQLQDDFLDSFGTEAAVGKQIGGDIQANKKTFLAIKALEAADATTAMELSHLKDIKGAEKLSKTLDIYQKLGVDAACKKAIEQYTNKALHALEKVDVPQERKQAFTDLLNFLMNRNF